MLPVSALSDAANKLRNLLLDHIDDIDDVKRIRIGHPKDTFEDMEDDDDKNQLNLFFYNVGYDGYPSDGLSEDPFFVRLYCLITALGAKKKKQSSGENDLRLIGEVLRVLHQQPILSVGGGGSDEIAQLQIIPHPLNLDNLNHIWSTQGDTAYRLSVAYEMSLAPIPLSMAVERSALVGEIGSRVQGDMTHETLPEDGFGITTSSPVVPRVRVDSQTPDWDPHICFMDGSTHVLNYTLLIPMSAAVATGLTLKVLIAGKKTETVELVWDTWNSSDGAWERSVATQSKTVGTDTIDPDKVDPTLAVDIVLPLTDKGQATLYAQRDWTRMDGSSVTLRSNPLLVTVYGASP